MNDVVLFLFWSGLIAVTYTYAGYGLILYLLSVIKRPSRVPAALPPEDLPWVTLVVAAYNEEAFIREKIDNTLKLDYPPEKLSIFFVTDGSTDATPAIVRQYSQIQLFHEPERRGKIHAVNRVMKFVRSPVVIFSDANTLLNREAVKSIVRHYHDPAVGGVSGEKRIFRNAKDNASGAGEGLYWKYESFLKRKDAEVYSVVGAAGELFSIRTNLYEPPPENTIIEDFILSLAIAARGYRFAYEPEAYAVEPASLSVEEEWKRKVRITAGGFQAMRMLTTLLNPVKHGILSFQYVSHRVLRWTIAPLAMPVVLICNVWLGFTGTSFYIFALAAQLFFYLVAFAGFLFRNKKVSLPGFFAPYYFVVMNLSVYAGFIRYVRGSQSVTWEKAQRTPLQAPADRVASP